MTPLRVNVEGGTDAGKREPFQGNASEWICGCNDLAMDAGGDAFEPLRFEMRRNPGYLARCPDCSQVRPA